MSGKRASLTELIRGAAGAGPESTRPDVTADYECAGSAGTGEFKFRAPGGGPVLGTARNGTTQTWVDGDGFTVLFPGGDRGRARIVARLPGRRSTTRRFPV